MPKNAKPKGAKRIFNQPPVNALGYRVLPEGGRSRVEKIGDILPAVLTKFGLTRRLGIERFRTAWDKMRGDFPGGADDLRLVGFRAGTLTIEVRGAALRQELAFHQDAMLQRFVADLPDEKIRKIRLVAATW